MASNVIGGGSIDAEGFLKYLLHFHKVGYTRALNVTQRAAGANMTVDVNIDSDGYGGALFATASAVPYFGYTNAAINSAVTTADPTNPRKDIVVAYIDLSLITTGTTDNLNAFKIKVVPGTAAASPVDPSGATIQASIGAGNPYVQLARVSLTAALGSITNAVITDLRTPAALAMPYLWGGALNTVGHKIPNQADGTIVTTTDSHTVTSTMLNPSKTTDANGWTIYDFGSFKKYMKASAQPTINIAASDRTNFTSINLPVGMTNLTNVHVHATMTGTGFPGNFFLGITTTSGATAITGFIGNNYAGGTLATSAFVIEVELTDV